MSNTTALVWYLPLVLAPCLVWPLRAAEPRNSTPPSITLSAAVQTAVKNYPSIRVSQDQMAAAAAAIRLARTAYLPKADAFAQFNRATRNNVFGTLLPQSTLPSISGPVIGSNNLGSVWGSAVGALVTWEPFDFGLRNAEVQAADATRSRFQAAMHRTEYEVAVATADAYLTVVAAQETVRAAQAGVDRARTIMTAIRAQVNADLRPGADQSRAEAELAAASTQLIQAQQAVEVSRTNLAQFTGVDLSQAELNPEGLLRPPPQATGDVPSAARTERNPVVLEQTAAIEEARAQLRSLERTYFPRFFLQGAAFGRGSGAELDGRRLGGLNGLGPNVQNYAVGVSVTFPILSLPALRAREESQNATIRAQEARSEQIKRELGAQWNRAVATLNGARRVALNTPIQVSSARTASQQATARYQAGLATIAEVADAQRLLTQAEIDDALARLNVWHALLEIATAAGDVTPFVAEASR
jgi:outer membrane protein TolC